MLDYHVEHMVKNVLHAYSQDEAAFKALFQPFSLSADILDRFWSQYTEGVETAEVRLAFWARSPKSLPTISIHLQDEDVEEGALGNVVGVEDGNIVRGALVSQSVQVTVTAQTPAMLRALTQVIRAGIFLMSNDAMASGYTKIEYLGLDQLSLEEQLVAESLSVRVRRFSLEAVCQVVVPDLVDSSGGRNIALYVAASNINPPGGVTPDV